MDLTFYVALSMCVPLGVVHPVEPLQRGPHHVD